MSLKFLTIPDKRLSTNLLRDSLVMTLNNINKWDNTPLAPSDFGDIGYGVLMNATKTQIELFSYDPSTIANPQITLLGRGLDYEGGTTSSPERIFEWPRTETIVQLSPDAPQVFEWLKEYIDAVAVSGAPDATDTQKGIVTLSRPGTNTAVAVNDPRLPDMNGATFLSAMTGTIHMYGGVAAPAGFLLCDGTAYNNFDYLPLLEVFRGRYGYDGGKTVTVSVTLNEFTASGHGLVNNQPVLFASTEDLPEGIQAHTIYYVRGATGSTFRVATTPDGATVPLLTPGTGTISVYPKFRVPDLNGRFPIGAGSLLSQFSSSYELKLNRPVASRMVYTYSDSITFDALTPGWEDGQVVVFKQSIQNIPPNTPLYVRRVSPTSNASFYLYTSHANYVNNVRMNFSSTGAYSNVSTDEMRGFNAQGVSYEIGNTVSFTGEVPGGLSANTTYYVFPDLLDRNYFHVATTQQGALDRIPIYISSAGGAVDISLEGHDGGIGQTGGQATHTLTIAEMPRHTHELIDVTGSGRDSGGGGGSRNRGVPSIAPAGGSQPHNNMPPYLAVNFITKT